MDRSTSKTSTAEAAPPAQVGAERAAIDAALRGFCDEMLPEVAGISTAIADAIRYALLGEGKRFRGILFLAAYRAAGGRGEATELAAAIEVVHAYSLVHDDLPCMDDDDMRRGRPTVHRIYGVPAATAAGVAMVPLAVRCAVRGAGNLGLSSDTTARIVAALMQAAGAGGMIGGQLLDLEGEGRQLTLTELETIHRSKTGALITASAVLGGMAANASEPQLAALERYGATLGLAFQIADDVLDVVGTTETLGKTAGRDLALQKSTYPSLMGLERASARAQALVAEGCAALRDVELLTAELESLAHFIIERRS